MNTCMYCENLITEVNEEMECVFGTECRLCRVCHRQVSRVAAEIGAQMHREWEWARLASNAG